MLGSIPDCRLAHEEAVLLRRSSSVFAALGVSAALCVCGCWGSRLSDCQFLGGSALMYGLLLQERLPPPAKKSHDIRAWQLPLNSSFWLGNASTDSGLGVGGTRHSSSFPCRS